VDGAVPGLYFPGNPRAGTPPFDQTSIPGGEQSTAQVVQVGQRTCVPFKCYTDVVVIQEQSSENKYWAPGVGGILTEPLSGSAQEIEQLVNIKQLSTAGLAELSGEALRLDRNAAAYVPSVFGRFEPAKRGL
jgi:predicted P-loop ATPase/GTPase